MYNQTSFVFCLNYVSMTVCARRGAGIQMHHSYLIRVEVLEQWFVKIFIIIFQFLCYRTTLQLYLLQGFISWRHTSLHQRCVRTQQTEFHQDNALYLVAIQPCCGQNNGKVKYPHYPGTITYQAAIQLCTSTNEYVTEMQDRLRKNHRTFKGLLNPKLIQRKHFEQTFSCCHTTEFVDIS